MDMVNNIESVQSNVCNLLSAERYTTHIGVGIYYVELRKDIDLTQKPCFMAKH